MDDKYYCNRFVTFHYHFTMKFRIHVASIAVASSDLSRHRLGYWRTLECLWGLLRPPPAISRTVVRREYCEAAFESSRQDAPESLNLISGRWVVFIHPSGFS